MMTTISIKTFEGTAIMPYIEAVAHLRIEVFREYPYLYEGSMQYELRYLEAFSTACDNVMVLVFDGEHIVGAATGMPLNTTEKAFQLPLERQHYDINAIYYLPEFVIKKEYRGKGLGGKFFEECEKFVAQRKHFKIISLATVIREENHILKPQNYSNIDAFLKKWGYTPYSNLIMSYAWKDVNTQQETEKQMKFWLKAVETNTLG